MHPLDLCGYLAEWLTMNHRTTVNLRTTVSLLQAQLANEPLKTEGSHRFSNTVDARLESRQFNVHRVSSILQNPNNQGYSTKNGLNFLFFNFLIDTFSSISQAPRPANDLRSKAPNICHSGLNLICLMWYGL